MIDCDYCNYSTLIECINSVGETILPIFFILEVKILYQFCTHNDFDGKTFIRNRDTCSSNYDKSLEWFQYFINHTKNEIREAQFILVINGHWSNMNIIFYKLATVIKIASF